MTLTNPTAPAYNAISLMAHFGTDLIASPPSCWRAAAFLPHGCGLPARRGGYLLTLSYEGPPAANIGARQVRAVLTARCETGAGCTCSPQ